MPLRPSLGCSRALFRTPRRGQLVRRGSGIIHRTPYSTKPQSLSFEEIEELLSKPTWSVESLLPPKTEDPNTLKISPKQLHHLLKLSALPFPENLGQEYAMLRMLSEQLHFVGEIQQVDTNGVEPLRAIRDETDAAEESQTVTLESLKDALAQEEVLGKHYQRIRRKTPPVEGQDVENWDVLGNASRKVGNFFVVESQRD